MKYIYVFTFIIVTQFVFGNDTNTKKDVRIDSIAGYGTEFLKGKRLFPPNTTKLYADLAHDIDTYLCLELGDTLLIVSNNPNICIEETLDEIKCESVGVFELRRRYYERFKKDVYYFFVAQDGVIIGYNNKDTLIYNNDISLGELDDNFFFISEGIINDTLFACGKIKIGITQKEVLKLLSIQDFISNKYTYIYIISPKFVKDMWYYKNNKNKKIKEYYPHSLILSFNKDILQQIQIGRIINISPYDYFDEVDYQYDSYYFKWH